MYPALRRNLLFVALVFIIASNATAQITSDFATSADGWTAPNSSTGAITYNTAGGNPTGNVSAIGVNVVLGAGTVSVPLYFLAPGKFIGNRSNYMNGTILFDLQQSSTGGTSEQMAEVIISSGTTTLYYFPAAIFSPAVAPTWTSFSVTFNQSTGFWKTGNSATATTATDSDILFALTNLISLQVRGRFRTAVNTGRLDNVNMLPPITINTQPSSTAVCESFTATLTTAASNNASISYQWQSLIASVWTDLANGGGYSNVTTASISVNTTGNVGAGSYRCRISGTGAIDVFTSAATITVNTRPTAPGVTNNSACAPGNVTLTASGGTAGQYRWYTVATGGTAIAGQTANTYTPSLTGTTTFYVAINNTTCESNRTAVTGTISSPPGAPTTTGNSSCGTGTVTLSASGGTNGQYRWYTVATGGTAITAQTNSTYTTPSLTTTTPYYAAINNGICESTRTIVTATINTPPSAPTTTGSSSCSAAALTLTASGGTNGQYRWYTVATGGTAIAAQTNSTYTTPSLTTTTPYYAAINNGTCESTRTIVTATINTPPTAPATTGSSSCSAAALTLTASGGTNGQYRWYTGGTAIAAQTNSTYTTPSLTTTTPYYAAINNGICESTRTIVTATINTPPGAPTTTGNSSCGTGTLTLTASGGTNGQYRWYTVATGGTAIAAQTNSTYTTPSLTTTTPYYAAINNGTCESARTIVTATINTPPSAPTTTGSSSCSAAALTLTASGGTNGQYRWYTVATGGTAITAQTNSTYTTPSLTTTTPYYAAINNGICESTRTIVTATINTPPTAPTTTGNSSCGTGTLTLTASGGTNGQYRWYTVATGGTAIANETSATYTTPSLASTTSFYVAINNTTCESLRTIVTATIDATTCASNEPPAIQPVPISAPIEGKVTLNLASLITDKDNNIDLSTLKVIIPPASGASATIDTNFNLILDYTGISFSGTEKLTIQVCDKAGACTQKELNVDVIGNIKVYNAISPNNDGKNDFLFLQYIDVLADTKKNKVTIFGRWGDVVFDVSDYNNTTKVFKGLNNHGDEVPSGTYFYKIEFTSSRKPVTGFITLKR